MKLSVVIPVYNAEKYLRQCLDSVLNQDLTEIEVIAVDDGSTDRSGNILDEYATKDLRVKVIHQENQGAGPARNQGIKLITGRYVTFFDADDFMPENCLKKAYEFIDALDVDIADFVIEFYRDETGTSGPFCDAFAFSRPPCGTVFSIHNDPDRFLTYFNGMIGAKFFKTEFLKRTGVQFMSLPNCNDATFVICNLIAAERVTCSDIKTMNYRIGTGTSITDQREKNPLSALYACEAITDFAAARPDFQQLKRGVANYTARVMNEFLLSYKTALAFRVFYKALRDEGLKHMGLVNLPKGYIFSKFVDAELRRICRGGPIMPKNAKRNIGFWKKITFAVPGIIWFFDRIFKKGLKETLSSVKRIG